MGNFVKSNTALPALKTDASAPTGLSYELDAADINGVWDAAGDLRVHSSGFANVMEYMSVPGTIDTDCSTAFANALAASKKVYIPDGIYPYTTTIVVPTNKCLIGSGAQASSLNYSGAASAIELNGCQGSRVENIKIVTTNAAATVRGIWMHNLGGSSQYNKICNNLLIQFNATGRIAGQVGLLIEDDATTTLPQFWSNIDNNRLLSWETSIKLLQSGIGADGVNQLFFKNNVCIANITGLKIGKGCGDHVISGLFGSHSSVSTFTDTLLVIGNSVAEGQTSPNSGNNICTGIVADMGANGNAFLIQTNSLNNYVVANNESSLADVDSGTNSFAISTKTLSGTNTRFRLPNLTVLSSGTSFAGTVLLGKVQQTQHRAAAALPTTYSTSDWIIGHTGLTGAIIDTLPTSFSGASFVVKDEDGSANGSNTVTITCQAGETIDGVASKVIINSPSGVSRIYGNGGGKYFTW